MTEGGLPALPPAYRVGAPLCPLPAQGQAAASPPAERGERGNGDYAQVSGGGAARKSPCSDLPYRWRCHEVTVGSFSYLVRARPKPPSACGISPRFAGGEGIAERAEVGCGLFGRFLGQRVGDGELGDLFIVVAEDLAQHQVVIAADRRRGAAIARGRVGEVALGRLDDGLAVDGVVERDEVAAVLKLQIGDA